MGRGLASWRDDADVGFAVEDDMQVADRHAGHLPCVMPKGRDADLRRFGDERELARLLKIGSRAGIGEGVVHGPTDCRASDAFASVTSGRDTRLRDLRS